MHLIWKSHPVVHFNHLPQWNEPQLLNIVVIMRSLSLSFHYRACVCLRVLTILYNNKNTFCLCSYGLHHVVHLRLRFGSMELYKWYNNHLQCASVWQAELIHSFRSMLHVYVCVFERAPFFWEKKLRTRKRSHFNFHIIFIQSIRTIHQHCENE